MAEFIKNSNPNFWDEEHLEYNCGGFAFNILEWYTPEDRLGIDDVNCSLTSMANELFENHSDWSEKDVANYIKVLLIDAILDDFQGEVRVVNSELDLEDDEELVAMRVAYNIFEDEDEDYEDEESEEDKSNCDFHFKVLRDGQWQEKIGLADVYNCGVDTEKDWEFWQIYYNSDTVYFAHKI